MSNNTVDIRGFLWVGQARYEARHKHGVAVEGWIDTGGSRETRLPWIASGRPAEIILQYRQELPARRSPSPAADLQKAPGVLVRAKLLSFPDQMILDVRSIHFFQADQPQVGQFGFSQLTLGGRLLPLDSQFNIQRIDGADVPSLKAVVATDELDKGGHHPVLLTGKGAVCVLERFQQNGYRPFGATVGGEFVTTLAKPYVQATFLCLEDEPDDPHDPVEANPGAGVRSSQGYSR